MCKNMEDFAKLKSGTELASKYEEVTAILIFINSNFQFYVCTRVIFLTVYDQISLKGIFL